jgi:arylsulfatase A-like enzyme
LDLYPTVAALAGFKPPSGLQGKNIAKTLDNPEYEVRDMAFSISRWHGKLFYLVRTKKWAFIQYGENGEGGMELYNMKYDPKQYNNLAHFPKYKDIVKEMKERLKMKLKTVRNNDLGIQYK